MQEESVMQRRLRQIKEEKDQIRRTMASEAVVPTLSEQEIADNIVTRISDEYYNRIFTEGFSEGVLVEIHKIVDEETKGLPFENAERIRKFVISNVVGLGPIEDYMKDPEITEIIVEHYDKICIEKGGKIYKVGAAFTSEQHLRNVIDRIVQPIGRAINIDNPIVDARLQDGSRVNAIIPPIAPAGAQMNIRKFSEKVLYGDDYLELGSLSEEMLEFLKICVRGKISLIVSGGTGSGKTTLLNMLSSFIPNEELIVTIEDNCELKLAQENVRQLECRYNGRPITTKDLVRNSLRMRPDRIIVGEIRDEAVVDMITAMSTGHEGSMSTVHANSPEDLLSTRFPILYSFSDTHFSVMEQNRQILAAISMIVQIRRMQDGSRKITNITAVDGMGENGQILTTDIFRYTREAGFYATGEIPEKIERQLEDNGISLPAELFHNKRKDVPKEQEIVKRPDILPDGLPNTRKVAVVEEEYEDS